MLAKRVLVGIGLLLVATGLTVGVLRFAEVIPRAYGSLPPVFLVLGAVGSLTAWLGLNSGRRWPLGILGLLYVPWTVIGLIGDTRQNYWPLVGGEAVGLVLVVWAIVTLLRLSSQGHR